MSARKMLTRLTKGQQLTIPARFRKELGIGDNAVLDIEVNRKQRTITIKPMKQASLKSLFARWDRIKNKTKKSVRELEDEYVRENFLH